jgi:iron(III) transport system ATP-binding protein
LPWADYLLLLKDGRIVQEGSPQFVYNKPHDVYCAGILGYFNLLSKRFYKLLSGEEFPGKEETIITRPEKIQIAKDGQQGVKATVIKSLFMGYYTMLELEGPEGKIRARINSGQYETGQEVTVYLPSTN